MYIVHGTSLFDMCGKRCSIVDILCLKTEIGLCLDLWILTSRNQTQRGKMKGKHLQILMGREC